MINTPAPLPNDVEALKQLVVDRDGLIAKLLSEIARLKRWRFGRSSERLEAMLAQLQLTLGDLPSEPLRNEQPEALPVEESTKAPSQQRVLPFRRVPRAFPAHLPRETVVHAPASCACPDCGAAMRSLGEDVSEMLDLVPSYFKVIRHVRPKHSCGHCARVIQQPAPSRPIDRGMAAAGLLAQIIVAKYADHCPLHRQEGIYRRSGVELDRATLASWVGSAAQLLAPLVDTLGRYVRAGQKLHADDTPVPVLDPGRGKTKTGRLWTYVRDDRPAGNHDPPAVWYRYSPDRQGQHPQAHLRGFRGILQADAYSGFGRLYDDGEIVEAACWAHARRKFYDLYVEKLLNDIDPYLYLRYMLERIAEHPINRIDRLLRWQCRRRAPRSGTPGSVVATRVAPMALAHIQAVIDDGGQVMFGTIAPIKGAAVAHDGTKTLAMLKRRPRETVPDLLTRLDAAIATAKSTGSRVDEINTTASDLRYEI